MKKWILSALAGAACALAGADRIATVNMERIFREYYKSRIAEDAIKQQAESYRSYLAKQQEELKELQKKMLDKRANSLNTALSDADKRIAAAEAAKAQTEFNEKKAEIELYVEGRAADMRELESRKRAEIIADIKQEISRRAVAEGFDFVLDTSGNTTNELPAVIVSPAGRDLSDAVIRELNRTQSKAK